MLLNIDGYIPNYQNTELNYEIESQESSNESSLSNNDCTFGVIQDKNHKTTRNNENAKNQNKNDFQHNNNDYEKTVNGNNYNGENDWFYSQPARSSEFFTDNGESNLQYDINEDTTIQSTSLSQAIVDKFAALNKIVSQRQRSNTNLLEMQNPLPIKSSYVKQNHIRFLNAELQNMNNGSLEYLSIYPEKNQVYVQCAFDSLVVNGAFKSNAQHAKIKGGLFTVNMAYVLSNVSASFHWHKVLKPAKMGMIVTEVITKNHDDINAVKESVNKKYRNTLGQAISSELFNSTHKGMVAQLKTQIVIPLNTINHEHTTLLYNMNWTEGDLSMQMSDIGGRFWKPVNRKIDSMSYARNEDGTYKMRIDVILNDLHWTSDLTVMFNGQRTQAKFVDFQMKSIRMRLAAIKSVDTQECRDLQVKVEVKGFQYSLNEQWSQTMQLIVESKLPRFIQRSLEAYMMSSLRQKVCNNQINNTRR